MDGIEVLGGHPLQGEIVVQGSKNAILPVIAGAVLHNGISVLHNCPKILDVMYMIEILRDVGCRICVEGNTLIIDASKLNSTEVSSLYAAKMRSSIILLGSLLGRMKQAKLSYPGGCMIGERPIDLHVNALKAMNASIVEEKTYVEAKTVGLRGCNLSLAIPSVGATENIILGAVLAEGVTVLSGAAREPEIVELCRFLNGKGAKIKGMGTDVICIEGVTELHDSEYTMIGDRIVAGTYLLAAAGTRGRIWIQKNVKEQLEELLVVLNQMGVSVTSDQSYLMLDASKEVKGVPFVETLPYPGFPTDLQSQLMAVLCTAKGKSRIRENMFETRFQAVRQFNGLGANITLEGKEAVIQGVETLHGGEVTAKELRGGAALVVAGLMAEGKTIINNRHFIDRGYEDICRDFASLGAVIRPLEEPL